MPREIPTATYRLQLTREFGFDAAAQLVPYLKRLGISHLYTSPFLKARSGSQHGYDIVDHAQLNPEFGGEEAFARLSRALSDADIGLILDFVPNHMGIGRADNEWWLDVLEWGPKSPHADSFDIDWETLPYKPEGGVLLPILGKPYGHVLEDGEIKLAFDAGEGSFSAWYYEHRLPIRPNRYGDILRTVVAAGGAEDESAGQALLDLAARHPDPREPSREQAPTFKAALAAVPGGAAVIERGLHAYQPKPGDPAHVSTLHRLLERQHYRLAYWRVASSEINYRRFFDVNDLAGIRPEDMGTFVAIHWRVASLIVDGQLHGLRIDHIDGLRDPAQYARRLQRLIRRLRGSRRPFYTLIEKILGEGEALPKFPGVAGTTGYEWLNLISRVLVDARGMPKLDETAHAITRRTAPFGEVLEQSKRRVLDTLLSSEFTVLVRLLSRIAAGHWRTRDYTLDGLRAALELFIVHFPVYRTYITAEGPSDTDRKTIARTVEAARAHWFRPDVEIFNFLQDVLTLDLIGPGRQGYSKARVRRFALKVQQVTGPMMAKSLEDTTFYRYFHLLALNEVGGDPALPALSFDDFHQRMGERMRVTPHGLTATATHDTKRGEDARARILTLSELPDEWDQEVKAWAALNAGLADHSGGRRTPSHAHEYMLYQTLVGAWPLDGSDAAFTERIQAYALKAAREGKLETSWTNPNQGYEEGLARFIERILDPVQSSEFLGRVGAFAQRIALLGALNSLAQLTLKATMPGVPDFYQGTEFWDLSLVDPDNRRPVDFTARADALRAVESNPNWQSLSAHWQDGRIKLALTRQLLALRHALPDVFTHGTYRPLEVTGPDRDHILAFARSTERDSVIVVVTRHLARLTEGGRRWPETLRIEATVNFDAEYIFHDSLSAKRQISGPEVPASGLLGPLPVAVLHARRPSPRRSGHRAAPRPRLSLPVRNSGSALARLAGNRCGLQTVLTSNEPAMESVMNDRDERALEERIRQRAHRLWLQEGCPEGRAEVHWDQAAELVAIEDNQRLATERVPKPDEIGPSGEPIEPITAVENAGEFPTLTDQGEQAYPSRRRA